jgi:hypothetical protein
MTLDTNIFLTLSLIFLWAIKVVINPLFMLTNSLFFWLAANDDTSRSPFSFACPSIAKGVVLL